MSTLFQALEKEFCPPLDSSLLAALVAEIESDRNGQPLSPQAPQVNALRDNLKELAAHADAAQLSEFADLNLTSPTDDTISSQDFESGITADTSVSSRSSGSSEHSFSTPLGFLQASLPDVPTYRLKKALQEAEEGDKEVDMWDLVGTILSEESIRELEERGLDMLDDDDHVFKEEDLEWEVVLPKSKKNHLPSPQNKRKHRPTKMALVDIRQQNHINSPRVKSPSSSKVPLPDLWTQTQSIATSIASYLSPHPPSSFLSYLHSPKYETPYQAICASLESLCGPVHSVEVEDGETTLLFNLLDILLPEFEPLDSEQRSRLVYETKLCIRATNGRGEDVLDLVKLLRELNTDASSGKWELGVYHLPPQKPPPSPIISTEPSNKRASLSIPSSSLTPNSASPISPTSARAGKQAQPNQWQTIPVRRVPGNEPHRLASSIPAYASAGVGGRKVKGSGNGFGKGGKGDVGELPGSQNRIKEHRRKQEEYLRQAAKMWQRGDKKTRGGEVAFYYAEKAREFQEMAKQEALHNARIMVLSKRSVNGKYDEIDLHGTTVYEAVTIVKEILQDTKWSQGQPLKIITGKGTHSANQVAKLKPAIKNALVEDGWSVGTWDAGLVVRGKAF